MGPNATLAPLGGPVPVHVQVHGGDGYCWGTAFDVEEIVRSDARTLKARR